jgi:hypothetical protein
MPAIPEFGKLRKVGQPGLRIDILSPKYKGSSIPILSLDMTHL